jgi:guanine deaminase
MRAHGLLHPRVGAGAWHLAGRRRPRAAGRAAARRSRSAPSSNLFLGSGLFDWQAARDAGVAVSVASDVGGGTSLSMLRTLADGYKVQALAGSGSTPGWLLHAATRGAAQALGLAHEIGRLEPGALMADFCVWDWTAGVVARHPAGQAQVTCTRRSLPG